MSDNKPADDKTELLNKLHFDRVAMPPRRKTGRRLLGGFLVLAAAGTYGWSTYTGFDWSPYMDKAQVTVLSYINKPQPIQVAEAHALPKTEGQSSPADPALLDASGYVVARRSATIGPKVSGKLTDVLVDEGAHVTAGQVIAHLDSSNARVAYNQAKASLDQSATALANARPVFQRSNAELARGLISRDAYDAARATYDQARTSLEVARATLDVARQNIDDTVVSAPFAGVVTVKAAQAGEIISPLSAGAGFTRTGIATIVDMDSLEVDVDVSENFINRVYPRQPCTITLNAYADWHIPGHVIAIVPTAERSKATVPVRIAIDSKDERILPEMGARVAFMSDKKPENKPVIAAVSPGVTIPDEAILSSGDQNTVFVVQGDHVVRRVVKLGEHAAQGQIVLSGLSSGEKVAVSGLDKLVSGIKVQVTQ